MLCKPSHVGGMYRPNFQQEIGMKLAARKLFFKYNFICNLCQYIQQIVYKRIQWHVEECPVALLCN
jgi:hypothetical protein